MSGHAAAGPKDTAVERPELEQARRSAPGSCRLPSLTARLGGGEARTGHVRDVIRTASSRAVE